MEYSNGYLIQSEGGVAYVYDANFKGPSKKRQSTDGKVAVVFGMFMIGWILLGIWAAATTKVPAGLDLMDSTLERARSEALFVENNEPDYAKLMQKYLPSTIVGLIFVMVAAMILVFLMRWIATPLLWTFIVILHLMLLSLSVSCFSDRATSKKQDEADRNLAGGIIFGILFCVLFLVIVAMRRRIKLALTLINEGSRAVCTMWMTVFFPIIPAILKISTIGFTLHLIINLEIKSQSLSQNDQAYLGWVHAYNIVAFMWALFFLSALSEMTLGGTFGAWYWTRNKNQVPPNALGTALTTSVKYHLGTLAFGSAIITMCRLLRMLFGVGGKQNSCSPLMCFRCCLGCMEKFLRRFNRNAYIMCAMHGKSLCASAMDAYQLILRNVLRYVALDWVTSIVFGLSKLLLAMGSGVIAYAVFNNDKLSDAERSVIFIPSCVLAASAYLIADAFLSVYAMAVDTLVLCFLEDCERNDGSAARPYYMSARLMGILAADSTDNTYQLLSDNAAVYSTTY